MDDYKHTNPFVLNSAEISERTPFCPEDQVIAEYFDGVISDNEQQNLEQHLADCRYCRGVLGMLNRQQGDTQPSRVPGNVLATAKALAINTAPVRLRKAPAWTVAALVLLGVFFVTLKQPFTEPEIRQLRNIEKPATGLEVTMPDFRNVVSTGSLIRWTEFPDGSHYTVFILSDAGDVLWTEHLFSNEWVLHKSLDLDPEGDFFFRVEAELPDGESITSQHLAFRIKKR